MVQTLSGMREGTEDTLPARASDTHSCGQVQGHERLQGQGTLHTRQHSLHRSCRQSLRTQPLWGPRLLRVPPTQHGIRVDGAASEHGARAGGTEGHTGLGALLRETALSRGTQNRDGGHGKVTGHSFSPTGRTNDGNKGASLRLQTRARPPGPRAGVGQVLAPLAVEGEPGPASRSVRRSWTSGQDWAPEGSTSQGQAGEADAWSLRCPSDEGEGAPGCLLGHNSCRLLPTHMYRVLGVLGVGEAAEWTGPCLQGQALGHLGPPAALGEPPAFPETVCPQMEASLASGLRRSGSRGVNGCPRSRHAQRPRLRTAPLQGGPPAFDATPRAELRVCRERHQSLPSEYPGCLPLVRFYTGQWGGARATLDQSQAPSVPVVAPGNRAAARRWKMDRDAEQPGDVRGLRSARSGSVEPSLGQHRPDEYEPTAPAESTRPSATPEAAAPKAAEPETMSPAAAEPEPGEVPADSGPEVEAEPPEPAEPQAAPSEDTEQSPRPGTAMGSQAGSQAGSEGPEEGAEDTGAAPALLPPREPDASQGRGEDGEVSRRGSSYEELHVALDAAWPRAVQKLEEHQLRSELLEQYRALLVERSRFQRYNAHLQHKILESLRRKKGLDVAEALEKAEAEAPEKEQAYLHCLATLEELKKQQADDLAWYHQELAQLKRQCQEKVSRVETEWRAFQALKKQVMLQVMGSCRLRGGRQVALREVEQLQALEDRKEQEMSAVRLENVQLRQSLAHVETRMRAQEDMTEGLLLIDFEQLKIENQTFNEKVEERNEELQKLHSKVTSNVQVITHVKEKLHFVEMENAHKKARLLETEAQVAHKRDILTKTKQARDSLRLDNVRLSKACGLLGKEALLRDLEKKVDKTEQLRQRLESLKHHHAGLTLSCRGVQQKIREAKAFLPT
ncbi:PREDICTED: coiled-coil domain-containing protein 96 [Elephantulus edwardii]|uniref:coiled-coil domain-containing protein 96 n=1 Tax=Elephantulus edwardii TaxID=28737 RepID=UPI0003F0B5D8|nr:PREDICTED: coiled-coil domain-containing protein 96 [Elephantulus edwardii]